MGYEIVFRNGFAINLFSDVGGDKFLQVNLNSKKILILS